MTYRSSELGKEVTERGEGDELFNGKKKAHYKFSRGSPNKVTDIEMGTGYHRAPLQGLYTHS